MKHTTEELLFAATVREIVSTKIKARLPEDATPADRKAAFADALTVRALIAETVAELNGIADVIAQSRTD